jgi:hypothetical protein
MPDVANAQKFIAKLTAVEAAHLRAVEAARREARRGVLEIIDRDGITHPGVAAMLREVDNLKRAVVASGRDTAKLERITVLNYARKQIQTAQRVGLARGIDVNVLAGQTAGNALDGEQAYLTSTPAWITQLESAIQTTAARLRISNAAPDEVSALLISESANAGRQSAWASAGTKAGLEEQRDVWTYGAGILGAYLFFLNESDPTTTYQKQAIATLDERTTDCCLRVHGQTQPIDEPFKLTGTPRYADEIQDPPFHWYAIIAGEMCITDRGPIPIENIRVGDLVLTHKSRYKRVTMALSRLYTGAGLEIETTGGKIKITPEHPVLTLRGWVKAGELFEGDVILGRNKSEKISNVFSSGLANIPNVRVNPNYSYSKTIQKLISDCIVFFSRPVVFSVKLKIDIQAWKEKIKRVFLDRFLKLEINAVNHPGLLKDNQKILLRWYRVFSEYITKANSFLFGHARHGHRIMPLHPFAGNRIGYADARMLEFLPLPNSGGFQVAPFNSGLVQMPLDNIPANSEELSNSILSHAALVQTDNSSSIKINSFSHDANLLYDNYTVKSITALDLQNIEICDLSVEDDESYCIADHYVHNCRSSETLYHPDLEQVGIPTEKMREMAREELTARERTGKREVIYPSHATARRGR